VVGDNRSAIDSDAAPGASASLERVLRLRDVMPDESPIDLDEHAALIAYDVEVHSREELIRRGRARVQVTSEYLGQVRRFLAERRRSE
jgi:hypothetical protein